MWPKVRRKHSGRQDHLTNLTAEMDLQSRPPQRRSVHQPMMRSFTAPVDPSPQRG